MSESWPSRHEPPPPALPRVEDLPIVTEGYDRQKVREAFDAFYRHAAQLDATLRTLEAVDAFQRSAAELRGDLRAIRAAGFAAQTWQRPYAEPRLRRALLPEAFPRVAAEVVFLIAVAVSLGVSGWSALPVIGVMTLALAIVWAAEWLGSRERPPRSAPRSTPARPAAPVAAPTEAEAPAPVGWAAFAERDEDRADAMTMVEPLPRPEPVAELGAPEGEVEAEVAAPEMVVVREPELEPPDEAVELEAASALEEDPVAEAVPEEAIEDEEPATDTRGDEVLELDEEPMASAEPDSQELPEPAVEVQVEDIRPAASMPASAEEEPPATEGELLEEPAAELVDLAQEEEDVEAAAAEQRPSFWRRMSGRAPEPEPVILEPPPGHDASLLLPDEGTGAEAEQAEPERLIDDVGVVEADGETEPTYQVDELGVVSPREEVEREDGTVGEEQAETSSRRRWFWQRRSESEAKAFGSTEAEEPAASELEAKLEPEPFEAEVALDPWEQGLELPAEPELELIEAAGDGWERQLQDAPELEPAAEPDQVVSAEDGPRDEWEPETDGAAEQEPVVLAEDEPLARAQAEAEAEAELPVLDEVQPPSDAADPEEALAERSEPEELPIEVLAEQAAVALERSRARRRHLRRARRR